MSTAPSGRHRRPPSLRDEIADDLARFAAGLRRTRDAIDAAFTRRAPSRPDDAIRIEVSARRPGPAAGGTTPRPRRPFP